MSTKCCDFVKGAARCVRIGHVDRLHLFEGTPEADDYLRDEWLWPGLAEKVRP